MAEVAPVRVDRADRGEGPHARGHQDDALLDIYRKLRPGEPPTREAAQTLLNNYYFNPKRYDLAKVGRYKINKKLGLHEAFDQQTLTIDDIVAAIRYIVAAAQRRRGPNWSTPAAPSSWAPTASRSRSRPTTSTTSATAACARWAS